MAADSTFKNFSLNAKRYRNFGAMINHATTPNAEMVSAFGFGGENTWMYPLFIHCVHPLRQAITKIPRGMQICIDYGNNIIKPEYFQEMLDMNDLKFPTVLPGIFKG